jgi:hypothetical protein
LEQQKENPATEGQIKPQIEIKSAEDTNTTKSRVKSIPKSWAPKPVIKPPLANQVFANGLAIKQPAHARTSKSINGT